MQLSRRSIEALLANNFIKKGSAFFRIIGDGVVQAVKYSYQPHGDVRHILSLGLTSMYAELSVDDFSSFGCCLKYEVANVCGIRDTSADDDQELLLIQKVLPWLNKMVSQRLLLEGIHYIEMVRSGEIYWQNSYKVEIFLICQEYDFAERVIKTILKQHSDVRCIGYSELVDRLSPKQLDQKMRRLDRYDYELLQKLSLVQDRDAARIQHYLEQNFLENCVLAKKKLGRKAIVLLDRYAEST